MDRDMKNNISLTRSTASLNGPSMPPRALPCLAAVSLSKDSNKTICQTKVCSSELVKFCLTYIESRNWPQHSGICDIEVVRFRTKPETKQ